MAEKLTETSWTGFIKKIESDLGAKKIKLDLDDGALVKALSKLDKVDDAKPEPRMAALEDVAEQITKLMPALVKRKKLMGDKPFGEVKDKLYALQGVAESLLKEAKAAAAAALENEEESPALLTSKMIPLIREVRKGVVTLQALVATAGKETVVLLSRKAISPARGKLLKEQMTNSSGLKFIRGECLFEQNALTFVVQAQAAGLAKRLRAALLEQTDLRLKVRVRGEDPQDVDDDGEDEGDDLSAPASTPAADAASAADAAARQAAAEALRARFEKRLEELDIRVAEALRMQRGDVTKIRAVAAFAREKGEAKTYEAGLKGLDMLEKLLDAADADAAGSRTDAAGQGAAAAGRPTEALGPVMEQWKAQRVKAINSLKAVATEIATAKHPQSAKAIIEIQGVIKNITAEPATLQQVKELELWLGSDDVVSDVCEIAEDIRTPLLATLGQLRQAMTA